MKEFIYWDGQDEAAANAEGWCVSETSEGYIEIEKLDESEVFGDDSDAIAFVYDMAVRHKSELHRRAIEFTLIKSKPLLRLIVEYYRESEDFIEYYACWAENVSHAKEQCEDANTPCTVTAVFGKIE
jgi:hypothetical protein